MESPFIFNKYVTGPDFIARSAELNLLTDMLNQRQNCLIIEPPKSGKKSLVNQAIINLKKESANFQLCEIDLFNVIYSWQKYLFLRMSHTFYIDKAH